MSTRRILDASLNFPKRRHPDGVLHGRTGHSGWLCRVCGGNVPPPRRTICSKVCAKRLQMLCFGGFQRTAVQKRDQGVCSRCGCDTERLRRVIQHAREFTRRWRVFVSPGKLLRSIGWPDGGNSYSLWEMDHRLPVVEGGGVRASMTVEQVMANLRTLCRLCHRHETADFARRRAADKNDKDRPLLARRLTT